MKLDLERVKKYEKWLWLAGCFVLVFVIYGQTIFGDFVFDDRNIVEHQAMLGDPNQIHKILSSPFWDQASGLYRPVTLLSYTINYIVFGPSPWGFHLVNLILYALLGWLIWLVSKRLFGSRLLAGLTAVLFLILPIHTEVVANISGRSEILALGFSLLVFRELLQERISWWRAGLWALLAMGSKETAIAAAPLAALVVYLKERNFSRELFLKYLYPVLVMLGGAVLYFGARFLVLGQQAFMRAQTTIVENPLQFVATKERVATAFKVLTMYLQKIFWPLNLCSDYSFNQIPVLKTFWNVEVLIGIVALMVFILALVLFCRRQNAIFFAAAIFLFSFLPIANLVFPTGTIAGERLMFYPSLGICLFAAWLICHSEAIGRRIYLFITDKILRFAQNDSQKIKEIFFGKATILTIVLILIIFYGVISFNRAGDWLTEKRLFAAAAVCAPRSVLSRSNLGAMYYLDGDMANAKRELLAAQEIYDGYPKGVNNLGLIYWKEGNAEKARELFLKALSLPFPFSGAYENLALMAAQEKNWAEAKDWLLKFYSGDSQAAEAVIRAYRGW